MCAFINLSLSRNFQKLKTIFSTIKIDRVQQDKAILKPFHYIYEVPSKYHRRIVPALNYWLQVPEKKCKEVDDLLQTLHTASLIVDDIEDNSKLRYGIPAAHLIHGVGLTVNAASHALAVALKKVHELGHPMAVNIYSEALLEGHRGQGIELYWRDNFICPSEEQYLDMLRQKSAILFVLTIKLLKLFSEKKGDFDKIGYLFGVFYSIRDDYCNLFNPEALKTLSEGKGEKDRNEIPENDITDGKFTLPIIHALKNPESGQQILNILKQRTSDPNMINYCISLLKKLGSDKYAEDMLRGLEHDIHEEINRLGGNPLLTTFMEELGNWRRHK